MMDNDHNKPPKPVEELLDDFRNWNRRWEVYDVLGLDKPKSIDEYLTEIEGKYNISLKYPCDNCGSINTVSNQWRCQNCGETGEYLY